MKTTIDIRKSTGEIRYSIPINKGAIGKFSLGQEDFISLPVSSESPLILELGDYVDLRTHFEGYLGGQVSKVYKLISKPKPSFKNGVYKYDLHFDAYYYDWNRYVFKYTPSNPGSEASWSLTANLAIHLDLILENLKECGFYYNGTDFSYAIDSTVSTEALAMTYDNIHILDALFELAKKAGCDCWISDNIINFGRCEFQDFVTFEIGVQAKDMSRSESSGSFATRVYAFGSTRNIPSNYRPLAEGIVVNGVVQRRLMLPEGTPFVDAKQNLKPEEIVEAIVTFDNVYPKYVGTIDKVSIYSDTVENEDGTTTTTNFYRFSDSGITFSKDYILPNENLRVKFESGRLNGMEFDVKFNPIGLSEKLTDGSWNRDAQLWEIVLNETYGRPLPDSVLCPSIDDKYILLGFDPTKISDLGFIARAEQELLVEAQKYVAKASLNDGTFTVPLVSSWVLEDKNTRFFEVGQRVLLVNPAFFDEPRESRVLGFEVKLDIPWDSPTYTIGESATYSRLAEIESKVVTVTYQGQTFTGGSGSSIYIIGLNDSTPATDRNVFSAFRTKNSFLSKVEPDRAKARITFEKGLSSDDISSELFSSGFVGGKGWSIYAMDVTFSGSTRRKTFLEVDNLTVRDSFRVNEFVINQTLGENGNRVFSSAAKVDHYDQSSGRIYLKTENGNLFNPFRAGDVLLVQQFGSIDGSSSKSYNLRVSDSGLGDTSAGADRLDWIEFDQFIDASGIPPENRISENDTLVRMDSETDDSRKGIISINTAGGHTPFIDIIYNLYGSEDSLKGRIGNLTGVVDPDFGRLGGFGAYFNNIYAKGSFILRSTGESIEQTLEATNATFSSAIKRSFTDVTRSDNLIKNSGFADVTVSNTPQSWRYRSMVSSQAYISEVVSLDGRRFWHLRNCAIAQLNTVLSKPSKYSLATSSSVSSGSIEKTFSDRNSPLNLIIKIHASAASVVRFGFQDSSTGDWISDSDFFRSSQTISVGENIIEVSGVWSGEGNFVLESPSEIYLEYVILSENKLDAFKSEISSSLAQSDSCISATVTKVNAIEGTISTAGWVTTDKGNTLWASKTLEDGSTLISTINQDASSVTIKASKISLEGLVTANNYFKVLEDGSVEARNATFSNVLISGSFRNPFVGQNLSLDSTNETAKYDNVIPVNTSGGFLSTGTLRWDVNQSGRRICLVNYKWITPGGVTSLSTGRVSYTAPKGYYFFENGVSKTSLQISREVVELMGYGTATHFYGWIVISRSDIMSEYTYGKPLKALAMFTIDVSSAGVINSAMCNTFDGLATGFSVLRNSTGNYTVTMPSHWNLSLEHLYVFLTGIGTNQMKATLVSKTATSFVVEVSDDETVNDGGFMGIIINSADFVTSI